MLLSVSGAVFDSIFFSLFLSNLTWERHLYIFGLEGHLKSTLCLLSEMDLPSRKFQDCFRERDQHPRNWASASPKSDMLEDIVWRGRSLSAFLAARIS